MHDGGYDLPYDVPGFKTGKFDFYQRVKKDKPRIRKPQHQQTGDQSESSDETKSPLNSKSNSTTPLLSVHSGGSEPRNMEKK